MSAFLVIKISAAHEAGAEVCKLANLHVHEIVLRAGTKLQEYVRNEHDRPLHNT